MHCSITTRSPDNPLRSLRVDFERLHLQYIEDECHSRIIVILQKNAYEVAQRIGILVSALAADEITNQLLYA